MFKGTGASPGIAIGKVLVVEHSELEIEKRSIADIDEEVTKLDRAVEISKEELTKVKEKALVELGEHEAEIFEAHLLVLEGLQLHYYLQLKHLLLLLIFLSYLLSAHI